MDNSSLINYVADNQLRSELPTGSEASSDGDMAFRTLLCCLAFTPALTVKMHVTT